jgi:hypothetical protein
MMILMAKLLKRAEDPRVKEMIAYVRKNMSKLRTTLMMPYGATKMVTVLESSPMADLAVIVAPIVVQRVQMTLNDSTFRLALVKVLTSAKAHQLEEAIPADQRSI